MKSACFFSQWATDPYYTKLYQEKYVKLNPALVQLVMTVKPGQITSVLDFVPKDKYLSSKFYKEWAQPQRYLDAFNIIIEKSAFAYAAMAVARNEQQGFVYEADRGRENLSSRLRDRINWSLLDEGRCPVNTPQSGS